MNAPPRRRLTGEERRTGILDAALATFSQSGYHSASIDDIAREAGVSKALIYEHFASKQELYADLIARNARELTQRLAAALVGRRARVERRAARRRARRVLRVRRGAPGRLADAVPGRRRPGVGGGARPHGRAGDRRGDRADLAGPRAPGRSTAARSSAGCACWPRCSSAAPSRWRTGGRTTRRRDAGADGRGRHGLRLARARAAQPRRALVAAWMSFVADVVDAADPSRLALVAIAGDGERREIAFGELADRSARLAGALVARGVGARRRGDDRGRQPARVGLRDARLLADRRRGPAVQRAAAAGRPARPHGRGRAASAWWPTFATWSWSRAPASTGRCWRVPDEALFETAPAPAAELSASDPALIVFTSGTAGEPKPIRHGHGYLAGQSVQAEHWYGARPGDLCWCTAASGWSLSARNAFVAAWLRGAAALLHDARFDPERAARAGRARGRERALHVPHRVPLDREARRPAAAAGPAPRVRRRASR